MLYCDDPKPGGKVKKTAEKIASSKKSDRKVKTPSETATEVFDECFHLPELVILLLGC